MEELFQELEEEKQQGTDSNLDEHPDVCPQVFAANEGPTASVKGKETLHQAALLEAQHPDFGTLTSDNEEVYQTEVTREKEQYLHSAAPPPLREELDRPPVRSLPPTSRSKKRCHFGPKAKRGRSRDRSALHKKWSRSPPPNPT